MTDQDTALREAAEEAIRRFDEIADMVEFGGDIPTEATIGANRLRAALSAPSTEASGEGLTATAGEELRDLRDAVELMDTKITPFGERADGTTSAYIVADSTWHRVLAIARGSTSENARKALDEHRRAATDPSHPTASDPLDIRFHDERRAEVAEMVAEGDANADDGLMGPDGLADGLLTLAEGWVRASLASHPTAEPGLVPFAIRIGEALRDMDGAKLEAESEGYQNMEWRQWSPDEIGKELAARLLREPSA
jgi:hypothetical protein